MSNSWPTKGKDLQLAELFMEEYAKAHDLDSYGVFELVLNQEEKRMDFRIADWVLALAKHFNGLYGASQGDFVTRQVISRCITQGETLH